MRKKDLTSEMIKRFPELPPRTAARMVDDIIGQIMSTLKNGGRVEIRGFGTFFCSERKGRVLNNPRTKQPVELLPRRIPRFRAGKTLGKRVDPRL